jgi:hypothetical protein
MSSLNSIRFSEIIIFCVCSADDYDDAIYYLEKALKYKSDDNETKRKLDLLRAKVKIGFEF